MAELIAGLGGLSLGLALLALVVRIRPQSPIRLHDTPRLDPSDIGDAVQQAVGQELSRVGSFQSRIATELTALLSSTEALRRGIAAQPQAAAPTLTSGSTELVVREISHSLGTPLARIRAEAELLSTEIASDADSGPKLGRLDRVALAVDLCQAFLFAFRLLGVQTESSPVLGSRSLPEAVSSLVHLFSLTHQKSPTLEVHLPDALQGYSKGFTLAVLAPLLENAVEATQGAAPIGVSCAEGDSALTVAVTNTAATLPRGDAIFREGVSTKNKHEGLGLPAALRLIESAGGTLSYDGRDSTVTFTVTLPRRV